MGFIAEIYDSGKRTVAKIPESFDLAFRTRYGAEMAAEKKMTELSKTKKYAGRFLRYSVRYVGVHRLKDLI